MKKILIPILLLAIVLCGCGRTMNDVISNEPSISGTVTQVREQSITIEAQDGEYVVSLDVELADSYTDVVVGDRVTVYYDGNVAETYPMQIDTVYAITLLEPADRSINEKP